MTGARRLSWIALAACIALATGGWQTAGRDPGWPGITPEPRGTAPGTAAMSFESVGGELHVYAGNALAGPVEVMLRTEGDVVVASQPSLPARATVPAYGRVLVARILSAQSSAPVQYRLDTVPGAPATRIADVEYGYPLATPSLRVSQGWGGGFSHSDDANRHAVDFDVPNRTAVVAARDGTVMEVISGFAASGLGDPALAGQANLVRVLHEDGSMALYAHLAQDGIDVRVGDHVRRGQRIAWSGNTGFSTAPHLHFVVQANRGMRLESIPFRMFGPGGILRFATPQ